MGAKAEFRVQPFADFQSEVQTACRGGSSWKPSAQVQYLQAYFTHGPLKARTLLIEWPYVDRHYMEEFSAYYSTAFRAPPSVATRVHFFGETYTSADLDTWIKDSIDCGSSKGLTDKLNAGYFGFVTIRPIPDAPIGRTLLRTYGDRASRVYAPAENRHRIHVLGAELSVEALPFQQQEQAVGACATAALWSALAGVARADGGRPPTPFSVTKAATRHFLQDRQLPASGGLDLAQSTAAIHESGYSPYVLKPARQSDTFIWSIKTYAVSGIPAVLVLQGEGAEAHAVTIAGIREDDDEEPAKPLTIRPEGRNLELRARGLSRVYVHDDTLGPYVRMKLVRGEETGLEEGLYLQRIPFQHDSDEVKAAAVPIAVWHAIFPLYPKLRLTARELIGAAGDVALLLRQLLGEESWKSVTVETWFDLNGRYLAELYELPIESSRLNPFLKEVALPRYVGVIRFYLDDGLLLDVVCDTTDIGRSQPFGASVLAILPFVEAHREGFQKYIEQEFPDGVRLL